MFVEAAVVALALSSIPQANMEQMPKTQLLPIEQNIVERTNAERRRRGLRALLVDERLIRSARKHARWMSSTGNFRHSAGVAENIAMGQPNSRSVLTAWMNSSGHRANILNGGYRKIGVAAYKRPNGQIYWVQQFMH